MARGAAARPSRHLPAIAHGPGPAPKPDPLEEEARQLLADLRLGPNVPLWRGHRTIYQHTTTR